MEARERLARREEREGERRRVEVKWSMLDARSEEGEEERDGE